MGIFDEAKKKLNLDETLEKVTKVVKETVDQIDDVIDKGRETLTEKFDRDKDQDAAGTGAPETVDPDFGPEKDDLDPGAEFGPGTEATDEPKVDVSKVAEEADDSKTEYTI
ncbi:hypothetical protein GA0111570_10736 [Raineyella antarctica]|uniref:MT0933-like antitoxin protein n=1 Tax=Raineyella antarctica TaxID=1577474 RepID=A0A1G6H6T8_9ACTN|nr:hypothetical protein [Raineyella antarctica]SDB89863.1 hypothetical protein GA0111570_10736 [Raineyella antarctica]